MDTRRPKGMPRWKWHEHLNQYGMYQKELKVDVLGTIFLCLLAISIPVFIFLFPYTLYRNSQAGECERNCQENACRMTIREEWCHEWEFWQTGGVYIEPYWACIGQYFSTKEVCREDCFKHCPSRISWKYTIIVGTPILIVIFIVMREFSKSRSRGSDEYF